MYFLTAYYILLQVIIGPKMQTLAVTLTTSLPIVQPEVVSVVISWLCLYLILAPFFSTKVLDLVNHLHFRNHCNIISIMQVINVSTSAFKSTFNFLYSDFPRFILSIYIELLC